MSARLSRLQVVLMLGAAQTLAWASSFYLLAVLAEPIAKGARMSTTEVWAAFSFSLLISAGVGPHVGRTIDRVGGRAVLMLSNVFYAAGLALMACAWERSAIWIAWALMGAGMGFGLYDAAFAALSRIYGAGARRPITGITLLAGFASTVSWPLSAWGLATIGWRETCLAWAAAQLLIALPLNAMLPRAADIKPAAAGTDAKPRIPIDRNMALLAFAFASGWTISTAMAAHLPRLLQLLGSTEKEAIAAGMLIGPAQVAARFVEASLLHRAHPLLSARGSAAFHPLGALLLLAGAPFALVFAALHGAGNGILTIARGTVPLALYGPENYGYRLGVLGVPSRMAQAASPLAFGLLIDGLDAGAFAVTALIGVSSLIAFCLVTPPGPRAGKAAIAG